ncbi:MAG: GH3 family domain-containing protein, partial [Casimicrobiaceae bacterium]
MESDYPSGAVAQLMAPFHSDDGAGTLDAVRSRLANLLVKTRLRITLIFREIEIAAAARDPMRAQRALLARILRDNRDTQFGRRHGFAAIAGHSGFVRSVPVSEFEQLRPYIDAQIERGENALTQQAPRQYVRTSGSTGIPKDIPLVASHLDALRRIHETAVAFQYRNCPGAFDGSILTIVGTAREGALPGGKSFGAASGIVAGNTPRAVQAKFAIPAAVFTIADSRVKYLLILRLALARGDITYIGTANATTLLAMMRLYHEHKFSLIDDVRRGTFFLDDAIPSAVREAVSQRLRPNRRRADELAALHVRCGTPRIADLWPQVRIVVTWTCASAGTPVSALRRELSPRTQVFELGYIASEFRATITLGRHAGAGLPTFDTHYFEFVECERWDRGERDTLTLERIRKGVNYYIIVTTPSGMYRYFINDVVRVTGFLRRTPLL